MSTVLTIDHGNSSLKVAVYSEGRRISAGRFESGSAVLCQYIKTPADIDGCIYATVGGDDAALEHQLSVIFGSRFLRMTSSTPLPIGVSYSSRHTLGLDRIAAAVGGTSLYPSDRLLVADAGTALTLDVIIPENGFCGGNISAGVNLRLRSLHRYTARLPLVSTDGELPPWGTDTVTALRCGAVRGVAAETAAAACAMQADRILLTGGDGQLIEKHITEITDIPVARVDDLVGLGLLRIYEYNEDIL